MGKINHARVILGGIVAGIVINILAPLMHDVLLKKEHEAAMAALNRTMPTGGSTMAVWILYGFVWGIAAIWLYAAIRPRFGPGAKTAVFAASTAWLFTSFLSGIMMWNLGLMPLSPYEMVLELIASILAVLAGAAVYKEAP
ncbi:MAG TPA: hypothetical protein VGK26_04010 [Thermoanaerobaculia bacterium]|jgi:hypothetical protein